LRNLIRKALTRRVTVRERGEKSRDVSVAPSERLVLGMYFAIMALVCLTALEIAHMVVVKAFSSEIFASITGVIGVILGTFFGQKA